MFSKVTEFLDRGLENGIPGYDCIIYHDGKCVYRHMNGYSDYEKKIPVSGKERYNIYSCSKLITCTAAMQLYEKGMFKLDDKLSVYMPEFEKMQVKQPDGSIAPAKNDIRIKDLFCMSAGFNYDCEAEIISMAKTETDGRCPTREIMKYLAQQPLEFEPSEGWRYSLCHDVLATFVEVVSGKRFAEFVKENIFIPMNMTDSTFLLPDEQLETIAPQYRFDKEKGTLENCGKEIQWFKFGSEYECGGAGCISTVEDYIKFIEGIRTFKLLKEETVNLMTTDTLTPGQNESYDASFKSHGYGFGLGIRCPCEGSSASDFGWDGAAGAYYAIDIQNKFTIYYAQHVLNAPNGNDTQYSHLKLAKIVRACLKRKELQ